MDTITGILLLIGFALILYFLFTRWKRTSDDGEASQTKYILIWLLVAFLHNIFINLFAPLWGRQLPNSILKPDENLISFCIFYGVAYICLYFLFVFTYSLFKNLVRSKVVPFVWLSSILGIGSEINQLFIMQELAYDAEVFFNYNVTAVIISQILLLFLILRWIKANPGFVLPEKVPQNSATQGAEPELPKLNVKSLEKSALTEPPLTSKSLDTDKKGETENSIIIEDEVSEDDTDKLAKDKERRSTSQNDNSIEGDPATPSSNAPPDPEFLKDEIYAASKFGDTAELIRLLRADGFDIKNNSGKYSLKSQDGSETMASDDSELINFGKRYARS